MTASDLIQWCKDLFERDSVRGNLTDAVWIMHMNNGLTELEPYMELMAVSTADLVVGITRYALPADLLKVVSVEYDRRKSMAYGTHEIYRDEIRLSIAPSFAVTDGMTLKYLRKAQRAINLASEIDCPDPYAVGYFALFAAALGDAEMQSSTVYRSEFLMRRNELSKRRTVVQTKANTLRW